MKDAGNNNPTSGGTLSERVRSLRLTESSEITSSAGSRWWWMPWVLCVVLFCATSLLAMEAFSPIDDDMIKKLAEERGLNIGAGAAAPAASLSGLGVKSTPGDKSTLEVALSSKGNVVPLSLIQVSPKIGGTVMELNFKEGDEVQEGDVLARLEDIEYRSDRDRALAVKQGAESRVDELKKYLKEEIEQAYSDWRDTVSQRDQAFAKYQRYVNLKLRGSVAPEDFELTKSTFDSLDFRSKRLELTHRMLKEDGKGPRYEKIAAAEAEVRQATADWVKAKWRWENTEVKAPKTGIILSKKTEEGNIVNPSAFSNGSPLVSMAGNSIFTRTVTDDLLRSAIGMMRDT